MNEQELNKYVGPTNPIGEEIDPREHMKEEQEKEQKERQESQQVKVVYIENGSTASHVGAAILGGVVTFLGCKVIGAWMKGKSK